MNKSVFLIGVTMLFSACMNTKHKFYYISLGHLSEVEAISYSKLNIKSLRSNSIIPSKYRLSRERYDLLFEITEDSYFPHFKIKIRSDSGSLFLKPDVGNRVVSEDGMVCSSYYQGDDRSVLEFGWSPKCLSEDTNRYLAIAIVDKNEALVATEKLDFILIEDGEYYLLDAI